MRMRCLLQESNTAKKPSYRLIKHGKTYRAKGPRGETRPADVIGPAIKVARIASGEEEDAPVDDGKDPNAKALGKKGGEARASKLSADERSRIASKAAKKRWSTKSG